MHAYTLRVYLYQTELKGYFTKHGEIVTKTASIINQYLFTDTGQIKQRKMQGCHLRRKLNVCFI